MLRKKLLTPIQKFVEIESFSGILLMAATVVALIWANSAYGSTYEEFWQYKFGLSTPAFELKKPLILWVNDGLMAIFFFLIGLEIKREFLVGELNSAKKIAFPLVGAIGGMSVPVLLYFFLNQNPATNAGWGIPMATDIAFSLAILKLLGDRVPISLKIFLTAFAIVDDIGAVLVIAVFYSSDVNTTYLLISAGLLGLLYILSYQQIYNKLLIFGVGLVVWTLFLKAGIHPTLAGILLAFAVPIRQKISSLTFADELCEFSDELRNDPASKNRILSKHQIEIIDEIESWIDKVQSPLQRLEHHLHDWVAYYIIPIFALANAGVVLGGDSALDADLVLNIAICLIVGNSIGITTLVLLAKRVGFIEIPAQISNQHIVGVAFLAGVGFTMSIFIASLAFAATPDFISSAKIGILIGSFTSGIIGYLVLRFAPVKEEIGAE